MAQNANTECLYTTVENISGVERVFGYLGPRGMRLAAGEQVTVRGNLIEKLAHQLPARQFKALERSLDVNGSLRIVSTPAPHLYDAVQDRTRTLAIQNGVLGSVDPCWDSSGSSDFSAA